MVSNKWTIIVAIVILLSLLFGLPDEINFAGFKWCVKNCNREVLVTTTTSSPTTTQIITPFDYLFIEDLMPSQRINNVGELATVNFIVKDEVEIPYNFTVNWFYNKTKYFGWYNESNMTLPFSSWYPTKMKGEWEVQVVLKWNYLNQTYSKDSITHLEVV